MRSLTVKQLWARKRRFIGAGIAVIIGVAFLSATMILGNAMTEGVEALFLEGYAGTDVQVKSSRDLDSENVETIPVDARLVDQLAALPEVDRALPVVEGTAQLTGADGDPIGGYGPPTIGQNWVDHDRNPYVLRDGRAPAGPREIVIDSGSADTGDLEVGDVTTVRVPEQHEVTVVGVAELASGNELGGVTFTWFDTDTAQELMFGSRELVTAVDLQVAPGVSPEALQTVVEPLIPHETVALTGAELSAQAMDDMESDFLGFFKVFLLVFAVIALLVASFSINNTFSILVAQRTRESALLRAIGASRRQILGSVATEALLIGVLASAAGLGAGYGLAIGLNALMNAGGFGVPTAGLTPSSGVAMTGAIVGVGITLLAAVLPAWRASRVAPLAALRDIAVDRSGTSVVRGVVGLSVFGAGIAALVAGPDTGSPMRFAGLGSLALFAGFVLLGPVVARLAAGVIGTPFATLRGANGKLARRNAMRNPKRTAGTASALMIGTAVVALFACLGSSIKHSMTDLIETTFGGDLVVRPDGFSGAGLPLELTDQLAALPEVAIASPLRDGPLVIADQPGRRPSDAGTEEWVVGGDVATMGHVLDLGTIEGDLPGTGPGEIAIASDWAAEHGHAIGDVLTVEHVDGVVEDLTISATYTETALMGDFLVDGATLDAHRADPANFLIMVELSDDVSLADGKDAVAAVTEPNGDPLVETSDEYLDAQAAQLDQMLGIVYALLGLAVVIALIGIANTLSLSLHERTRELGLLRAVGQSRRALRSTVRWESVIIAIFGTVGGLALGTFMCWGLVRAISVSEGFGSFAPSYPTLGVILGVAVVSGVVAAARPARRAAKLDVLEAIATE